MTLPEHVRLADEVHAALANGQPVVALESTVISHGLPRPTNLETAKKLEQIIREEDATPATVGIISGVVTVGLSNDELEILAFGKDVHKVSRRDYGIVVARREHGATTVAGTIIAAHMAGIRVFATGGIGGVHRGDEGDVSADLPELARTPVVVICAGAKSILDLPRTLEWLETAGVSVIGYRTDEFPAFYAVSSGLPVDARADSPDEAAAILLAKWALGLGEGALVVVPPPADLALPADEMEQAVAQALATAATEGIRGKALTPYLLERVSRITAGRSLVVNIALLEQNAQIAARIAGSLS